MNYQAIAEWSQVVSSLLFLLALVIMWLKFLQPAVLAAQAAQNARILEAERHRDEAKAALEGLHADIDAAQRDAAAMKNRVGTQIASERADAIAEAREAGERALKEAQGELARSRVAAAAQLRDELIEKALAQAKENAQRRIDDAAERKLTGSFVRSLEGSAR